MASHENEVQDADQVVNGCQEDGLQPDSTLNKDILGMSYSGLHFGTKEDPAVVQSLYNKIIGGCPGGAGVSEGHDMVWFWLEKDKPHECAVCSQFFELQVVNLGGQSDGGHCESSAHQ